MNTAAIHSSKIRPFPSRSHADKSLWQRLEVLISLLILAVCILLGVYLASSPYFNVKRVLFEGSHMVPEQDILAAAGISQEDSILFLDGAAVARRVESIPYIKKCEVKRMYPDEVLLRVIERKAIASVMVNNHVFEIDRENVVLRELSPFAPHTGPLITNLPNIITLEPGVALENSELHKALELWEQFKRLPFASELTLSEISAEKNSVLRMFFNELPYEMRWGRSNFEKQTLRLAVLWSELQGNLPCEQYLDLRFDADLVCK